MKLTLIASERHPVSNTEYAASSTIDMEVVNQDVVPGIVGCTI